MESRKFITPFVKQCFVTAAVGANIISFGCVCGFPGILLPQLKSDDSPIPLSKEAESWIASTLALSLLLGNFVTTHIMERLGRKPAHYIVSVVAIVGWYITILATSVEALIAGRLLLGISGGILMILRSILIGEYTSPRNRGAFLTTVSLTQAFGIFFVHLMGSLLSWQKTAFICVFFPFTSLVMITYTPESPSWLLAKGRYDECRTVFRWLRGIEEDQELEDMINARKLFNEEAIKENKTNGLAHLLTIIRKKEFYKPIMVMIHMNAMSQFSGGTTMASYSTVILGLLMGSNTNAHFWMVVLDTQRIIFNAVAVYVINRVKRRVMVFSTGGLSVACHFAITIYAYCRYHGWEYDAMWLPALLINLQFFAVAVGTVPMPQVIGGEVFPLEYRSIGGTISLTAAAGMMFLVLKSFPSLIDSTGLQGTYLLYAVIILVNLIIVLIMLPETKGKTLQQIEDEFRGRLMTLEELESRISLSSNPVESFKRKLSEKRCSIPVLVQ
ncbi:facilitated trehalose transporter Tret1-like [Melitaea cinxia]|uniref:facilitated trehalose transporter Tret1-like n=1 Tax=Melitaea cinxia TaxID=113334 RepID=UPI001E27229C|nr:facilitated trehalose transporter Tret1-like [Melitaea cinxia]